MKRIDFEHGTVTGNILGAALPMLVAQILNLLYNIVDRIYIARIPNIGTAALGAVGLCFPLIVVITAFSNLFGSGGAPLFSIYRGKGEPQRAANVMNTSFTMVCVCAVVLMAVGFIFARPLLVLFGASTDALVYAYPYLMIYLIGTLPSMIATGMNPFINAQGYSTIGMTSVAIGAVANLLLDPLFIFVFGFGVQGAAIATVISQALSAVFVFVFLTRKSELKVRFLKKKEFSECIGYAKNIVSLGTAGFIMQLTNSLVSICCNNILSDVGGDIYISVMTIVSSVRQLVETPIYAMNEGTSPILSYNYGACRPARVRKAMAVMSTSGNQGYYGSYKKRSRCFLTDSCKNFRIHICNKTSKQCWKKNISPEGFSQNKHQPTNKTATCYQRQIFLFHMKKDSKSYRANGSGN